MPIPDILYHYCSNDSLLSIVTSKTLLLTAVTAANDYEETQRTRPFLLSEIAKYDSEPEKDQLSKLQQLFDINNTIPFIASFSENPDQLSQWRGYADDATGVSIGFNMRCFGLQQRLPLTHVSASQTIGVEKVIYDDANQRDIVGHLVTEYLKSAKVPVPDLDNVAIATAIQLRQFSLIFKNPGFREEAEWRIVHTPILGGPPSGALNLVGAAGPRKSRMKRQQIVTSIPLDLKKTDETEPLARVFLGPRNPTHLFDLANLFHEHGFVSVDVRRSSITYR